MNPHIIFHVLFLTFAPGLFIAGLGLAAYSIGRRRYVPAYTRKLSLREEIRREKAWYLNHYGALDWHWYDEGLPYTIQDYHSHVGSVVDFTADDFAAAEENGWGQDDVAILCDELEFS